MLINNLYQVAVGEKEEEFDFTLNQRYALNACGVKNGVEKVSGFYIYSTPPAQKSVNKLYNVEGQVYAYLSDSKIYKVSGSIYTKISDTTFLSAPKIASVIYNGEKKLLIFSENNSILKGLGETEVEMPIVESFTVFNGMFFASQYKTLRYSKPFDFTNFSVDLDLGGYIEVGDDVGEILNIFSDDDGVLIVGRHGIGKLKCIDTERTDYEYKVYSLPYLNIQPDTVAMLNGEICFIENNDFYTFKGGKLKKHDYLDNVSSIFIMNNQAVVCENYYLLEMADIELDNAYLLCINNRTGEHYYLPHYTCLCEGGYAVNDDGKVCKFDCQNAIDDSAVYKSVAVNFNSLQNKTLCKISLKCWGEASLKVSGDFGERTLKLKNGINILKVNLNSTHFTFEVSANNAIRLSEVKLNYRT